MIKHSYALDNDGSPVSIYDAIKKRDYKCIDCGGRMRLAGGDGTQKNLYFFHIDKCTCTDYSGETTLHNYAKHYFANLFSKANHFEIKYHVEESCCKEICRFDRKYCRRFVQNCFDLKKYYDRSDVERKYGDFTADVLLTSNRFPDDPIFIEIEVTHACSEEKIQTGYKIIEIKIPKNYDVEKHPLKITSLAEGDIGNGICVKYYNFKNRAKISATPIGGKDIRLIALKKDGRVIYQFNNLDCSRYGTKVFGNSIIEVQLALEDYYKTTTSFKAIANLYGIPCKNCRFCSLLEYEYGWNKTKLVCGHTKETIRYGNEAENCGKYNLDRYETLKWAAKINQKAYDVIDQEGQFVFPIFVNDELEKMENEIRNITDEYSDYYEEEKPRVYKVDFEISRDDSVVLNEQNLEEKISDFEKEIKDYEGWWI
ncbi:MAG: hypothetical protein IJ524_08810 [Bacteroidales bacterium]|nr:hypothetical protein [Bacteroidales bacterium]